MERNGSTAETDALWEASLEGFADEEVGSTDEAPGLWGGLFRTNQKGDLAEIHPDLADAAGAILTQDSSGNKETFIFTTKSELNRAWKDLVEELAVEENE